MRSLLFICAVILSIFQAYPQDKAIGILEKAGETYEKAGGVSASFLIDVLEQGGVKNSSMEGNIQLKGSKFKLMVPDELITWFDGKNQWLYLINTQEVNLSTPSEEELLTINPINVFQWYKFGYNSRLIGEKKYKNSTVWHIELKPQDTSSDTQNISIYFDKTSYQPMYIHINRKDGSGSKIYISNYKTNQGYQDNLFMFPQKDYPTAEVIDLR